MHERHRAQLERSLASVERFIALAHECTAMAQQMNEPDHVAIYEEKARLAEKHRTQILEHLAKLPRE